MQHEKWLYTCLFLLFVLIETVCFFYLQVIKTLVIVVTIFVLCWLPLHVFFLILDFHPTSQSILGPKVTSIYLGVHWLAMSNSFANPIIYGFTNESFRVSNQNVIIKSYHSGMSMKVIVRANALKPTKLIQVSHKSLFLALPAFCFCSVPVSSFQTSSPPLLYSVIRE